MRPLRRELRRDLRPAAPSPEGARMADGAVITIPISVGLPDHWRRSIDLLQSLSLGDPGRIGPCGSCRFKTRDQTNKRSGSGPRVSAHCLFAASVNMNRGGRVRPDSGRSQLRTPSSRLLYGKAGERNDRKNSGPHSQSTPQLIQTSGTAAPQLRPQHSKAQPPL